MLDDTITLSVDEENDGVGPVNHVYTRYEEYIGRSVYISANHSLTARDMLNFYRTFPKAAGNFKGVAKSALKITRDYGVPAVDGVSTITSPIIVDLGFSIPVGCVAANRMLVRQILLSALDNDTLMEKLTGQLIV